jgi:hypothetical protein
MATTSRSPHPPSARAFVPFVGMDERGRAALDGVWAVVSVLWQDGPDPQGLAFESFVGRLLVDVVEAVVGLALVRVHVAEAGEGREHDLVGGGEVAPSPGCRRQQVGLRLLAKVRDAAGAMK